MTILAKKFLKLFFRLSSVLLLAVLFYILIALAFFGASRLNSKTGVTTGQIIPIYLFADKFHADVVIPINPMDSVWDYLLEREDFPVPRGQIKMLSIGWGSREFYLNMREWNQLSLDLSLKAMAFDYTVMHISAYRSDAVDLDHPQVSRRYINQSGYQQLLQFIRQSHKLDYNQRAIHIPNMGYGKNDAFFEADGRYHPLRTCNQWTGEALRQAGIMAPLWTPFSYSLK
ncbi:MAG: TIGR02117 family protein [Gammaproteobacteria bacterium]|nr:TIGR02117 family protein [Gammaproteobacteria bacterium]